MTGLMKAYQNKTKFGGEWDDNLQGCLELYESLCKICHLTDEEKTQSIPFMLRHDAMKFYSENVTKNDSYAEVLEKLKDHYTSEEQKGRMLTTWQSMRLTTFIQQNENLSEMDAFRQFTNKLNKIQKQLSSNYQHDFILRDQLILATDLDEIQRALRERIPTTAKEPQNKIATFLSQEKGSAGTRKESIDTAMYSTGREYGGEARRNLKPFRYKNRISSNWISGVKGVVHASQPKLVGGNTRRVLGLSFRVDGRADGIDLGSRVMNVEREVSSRMTVCAPRSMGRRDGTRGD